MLIVLGGRAPGGGPLQSKEKESFSQLFRLPTLDKQETWFPTLQKTVWVLAQLHDFVNVCLLHQIVLALPWLIPTISARDFRGHCAGGCDAMSAVADSCVRYAQAAGGIFDELA